LSSRINANSSIQVAIDFAVRIRGLGLLYACTNRAAGIGGCRIDESEPLVFRLYRYGQHSAPCALVVIFIFTATAHFNKMKRALAIELIAFAAE
jgi:hypothetical protein